ncbi:iron complex transport system substrate-binding protein [Anaerobacterium chartisolvens]|uniref:Iron complex transport system substrate-binding protein n=1 Tax=Anaerobacterium chartisolvens TaxID=1297424 RepID=A0A369BDL9_9FIRM|nr:ABC transporter substrate-binding protein [Anaerobacterium chartisolvens]RCX19325.1 iron complex transport system substrate-binding protein [Anaerobacterium chartisolvens]
MIKLNKKIITLAVSVVILLTALTGCASGPAQSSAPQASGSQEANSQDGGASAQKAAERTVVDHAGNTVVIPADINRVVISSIMPLPSVFCLFEGASDKLVGMDPSSMAAAKNSILPKIYPEVLNVSTDFIKDGSLNIEELMKLKPDVVLYSADNTADYEVLSKAGIPAVAFSTSKFKFDTVKTFDNWVSLMGEIFGQQETAKQIASYGYEVKDEITKTIEKAGDSLKRPRALILFRYDNGSIKTSGSNFFGQYWLDTTGAENVAKDLKGMAEINMEQIYQWDPEIIFITNFTPYQPEDLYENSINGFDWSRVKAVQDKKVYKFPLGMYRWFPPASDTPLSIKWLATKNQPELFKDLDMDKEIREYYKKFYSYDLSDEQVEQIFHPSSEASGLKK